MFPKRLEILRFLAREAGEGRSPAIPEIARAVGLRSTQTVFHHLKVEKSVEIVWKAGEDISKERQEDGAGISDYGEFSGAYIDTSKTDYLGTKKTGYIKKKGF